MKIPKLYKAQHLWNTALFMIEEDIAIEKLVELLKKPIFQFSPVRKCRTSYHTSTGYADPFLFANHCDGYLYLFYEDEQLKAPAPICAMRTKDGRKWENLGIVLRESFHLSFPFVFVENKNIYMLPETRSIDEIRMYKSVDFPYIWQPITLQKGDKYVDSSLIKHHNVWYLFTTVWYGKKNGLHIYYADSLDSEWKSHPLNPIHNNLEYSRNGGSVFEYKGKIYRPAQNCTHYYGENVALYEIEKLSKTEYTEKKQCNLIDTTNDWSKYGGHHFNQTSMWGKTWVSMDGLIDDNCINNHTRKLFNLYQYLTKKR